MARKSGFVRRRGSMVRETRWLDIPAAITTLAAASTASVTHVLTAEELALRPFTIIRTRGFLHTQSDQSAASENFHVALGVAVVSDQASAIGVTAVPTPFTDQESDLWLVYEMLLASFLFGDATGFIQLANGRTYDSKGARKVEDGQDVNVILETSAASSGAIVQHSARMLIKLH